MLRGSSQGGRGAGAADRGQIPPGMDRRTAEVDAALHLFLLVRQYGHMGQRIHDEVVRLHNEEGLSCLAIVPIIDDLVMRESPTAKEEWERKERERQQMISDPEARATLQPRNMGEEKLFKSLDELDALRARTAAVQAETDAMRVKTEAIQANTAAMRAGTCVRDANSPEEIAHRARIAEIEKATAESLARAAAIKKKSEEDRRSLLGWLFNRRS
ncbi:MAG: hypothetical protein LBF24_01040 [Puniceicoccales bacterium]|nr:hypothetical protein [Puniceicoccales bacterium]